MPCTPDVLRIFPEGLGILSHSFYGPFSGLFFVGIGLDLPQMPPLPRTTVCIAQPLTHQLPPIQAVISPERHFISAHRCGFPPIGIPASAPRQKAGRAPGKTILFARHSRLRFWRSLCNDPRPAAE